MSYTKIFYTKLSDDKINKLLDYLLNHNLEDDIVIFPLLSHLRLEYPYFIIGYDNSKLIRITAYRSNPLKYYDNDIIVKLNQDIFDNLPNIPKNLKDHFINLSKILFQNGTNRLQEQETFESGSEDTGRRPIYGEPDRIEYAAGRTCNKASVIYQREGLRKPEVKLSVRYGEVHKASW